MSTPLVTHEIPGGAAYSLLVRAGRTITLTALGADACASTLLLGAGALAHDRLNLPDTLKAQHSARVRPPMVLMSDGGLALASVTGSSLEWHDALCGHTRDEDVDRFGVTTYAADRNARHLSARAGLLAELRKQGRAERDLHGCVNFFARARIADDEAGTLTFAPGHSAAGDWVALRAEVDLLVVVAAALHPLDATGEFTPAPVRLEVAPGRPAGRTTRPTGGDPRAPAPSTPPGGCSHEHRAAGADPCRGGVRRAGCRPAAGCASSTSPATRRPTRSSTTPPT